MTTSHTGSWLRLMAAAGTLALAVGLGGGALLGGADARTLSAFPTLASGGASGVVLTEAGRRVASGMKCLCGCPDLLVACGCSNYGGAAEIKRFIMQQLGAGKTESEVRLEVVAKYGPRIQGGGR